MTDGERKMFARGVVAGGLTGLAFGLTAALFITLKAPGAVWLPGVFLPLALLTAWWVARELDVHGRRGAWSLAGRSTFRRRPGS